MLYTIVKAMAVLKGRVRFRIRITWLNLNLAVFLVFLSVDKKLDKIDCKYVY